MTTRSMSPQRCNSPTRMLTLATKKVTTGADPQNLKGASEGAAALIETSLMMMKPQVKVT